MTRIHGMTAVLMSLTLIFLVKSFCRPVLSVVAQGSNPGDSSATWHFVVTGDSRNCGNVIMPVIAAAAKAHNAAFYWHLGDFRAMGAIDEDFADNPAHPSLLSEYEQAAWQDFIENQLNYFVPMPVFLTIGNHELIHQTRTDYIAKFKEWLSALQIARQRLAEDSTASPRTYYHWTERGVDFIAMDNASDDQFDAAQIAWFEKVLENDESNTNLRTIVVGMHKALPDSIAKDHSMSESGKDLPVESGRQVYRDLLKAQNDFHKKVYVLASHSHYYMNGIFNTAFWKDSVLPGWIIGTAGAQLYQLPDDWRRARQAMQGAYDYLLATVNPEAGDGHAVDGSIRFEFRMINRSDVPSVVQKRFTPHLVDFCFDQNMRNPG